MRFLALTVLLLATVALASAYQKKAVILGSKSFLASVPTTCINYLEALIKWEIIVTSKKNIGWIVSWHNTTNCSKCLGPDLTEVDVDPCMNCLLPYEPHVTKLPGCRVCYDNFTQAQKVCKRCLTEIIYVTETVTCALEAKVKKTMTLLHMGV